MKCDPRDLIVGKIQKLFRNLGIIQKLVFGSAQAYSTIDAGAVVQIIVAIQIILIQKLIDKFTSPAAEILIFDPNIIVTADIAAVITGQRLRDSGLIHRLALSTFRFSNRDKSIGILDL